jgi:hypothetical protein
MEFRFEHTPLIRKVNNYRLAKKHGLFGLYDYNSDTCYIFNNPFYDCKPHNFYTTLYLLEHEVLHGVVYKIMGEEACLKLDNVIFRILGPLCPRMFDWE